MLELEILEKIIDSEDFTVGGGSASALAGAMAAGLIGMVARLSTKKEYGLSVEQYIEIADKGDKLSKELILGAKEDRESFKQIKQAYGLPKATFEEKLIRADAVEKAAVCAATVPLNNGELCAQVQKLGALLKGKSNPNASSDLEEGNLLINAAILGCILNIKANLPLIKDDKIKEKFKEKIYELEEYSR